VNVRPWRIASRTHQGIADTAEGGLDLGRQGSINQWHSTNEAHQNSLNLKEQVYRSTTSPRSSRARTEFGPGDPGAKIVGFGTGKAKEISAAIKKGMEAAKKNLHKVNVLATTIQHTVLGKFGSGLVLLKPAPEGTGVIAGGPVRAVITAVGIQNVLTKSIGSHNPHNVVKATIAALEQLRDKKEVAEMRGLDTGKVG
jgi:small subunit ribosomal protein S5